MAPWHGYNAVPAPESFLMDIAACVRDAFFFCLVSTYTTSRLTAISIEDDPIWAGVIAQSINDVPNAVFLGSALSGLAGLALCKEKLPDIAFVDLGLPDTDGFELLRELLALSKPPRIVFLTVRADELTLFRAWTGPIEGLVWKTLNCRENLRATFAALSTGRRFFPPDVLEAMNRFRSSPTAFFKILSAREQELFEAFVRGESNERIARETGLSSDTVQTHRKRVMAKLNLHTKWDLIQWGAKRGFSTRPVAAFPLPG